MQQATEKLIKYQIYQRIENIDNKKMYTHDVSKLISYAEAEGLEIDVPDYICNHANAITDWEAGSRYDIGFSIRIDTLRHCYEVVDAWEKKVQ